LQGMKNLLVLHHEVLPLKENCWSLAWIKNGRNPVGEVLLCPECERLQKEHV
jgi:hypothetical protein